MADSLYLPFFSLIILGPRKHDMSLSTTYEESVQSEVINRDSGTGLWGGIPREVL